MAISEVSISGAFLSEVEWARDTVNQIREAKLRDVPLGLDATTHQPDALFTAFARRDLLFYPYVARPGFNVGNSDAYMANIATSATNSRTPRRTDYCSSARWWPSSRPPPARPRSRQRPGERGWSWPPCALRRRQSPGP